MQDLTTGASTCIAEWLLTESVRPGAKLAKTATPVRTSVIGDDPNLSASRSIYQLTGSVRTIRGQRLIGRLCSPKSDVRDFLSQIKVAGLCVRSLPNFPNPSVKPRAASGSIQNLIHIQNPNGKALYLECDLYRKWKWQGALP